MTIHIAEGDIAARTRAIVADLRFLEGPLLPILHEVQQEFGYVPQEAMPVIAEELNLSRAEVHVEDIDTVFVDFLALARIDRTDADLEDILWIDERTSLRQDLGELRLATEEGDRHTVNIAGRRRGRRIEIGMPR